MNTAARRELAALAAAALAFLAWALVACSPAVLSALGLAAPAVGSALGSYAAAASAAQQGLPATDPAVVALRADLAALAAAETRLAAAREPVACVEPVPVGDALPPPAVDTDALAAALQDVAASNRAVVEALGKVKARKPRKVKVKPEPIVDAAPFYPADAGSEGGE